LLVKIIRASVYLRSLKKLHATDAELVEMEKEIAGNPEAGDVIPGLRGLRKLRFPMGGKGK